MENEIEMGERATRSQEGDYCNCTEMGERGTIWNSKTYILEIF